MNPSQLLVLETVQPVSTLQLPEVRALGSVVGVRSLSDGSRVEISGRVDLGDEQLAQVQQSLTRVEPDDQRPADLPVVPGYWEGTDGLCVE